MYRATLFGELQVSLNGEPVRMPFKKCGELIARVAVEPGVRLKRSDVAEDLWPHHDRSAALTNLRKTIQILGQKLPDLLEKDGQNIWFRHDRITCDLWDLLESGDSNIDGPFLTDIEEEWAHQFRSHYRAELQSLDESHFVDRPRTMPPDPWDAFTQLVDWHQSSDHDFTDLVWASKQVITAVPLKKSHGLLNELALSANSTIAVRGLANVYLGYHLLWATRTKEALAVIRKGNAMLERTGRQDLIDYGLESQVIGKLHVMQLSGAAKLVSAIADRTKRLHLTSLLYSSYGELDRSARLLDRRHKLLGTIKMEDEQQFVLNRILIASDLGDERTFERLLAQCEGTLNSVKFPRLQLLKDLIAIRHLRFMGDHRGATQQVQSCIDLATRQGIRWSPIYDEACTVAIEDSNYDLALKHFLFSKEIRRQGGMVPSPTRMTRLQSQQQSLEGVFGLVPFPL